MTSFKTFAASALLFSAMAAPPVLGQAAIQEPGSYAFYHPHSDVLNANRIGGLNESGAYAAMDRPVSMCVQRQRARKPGARADATVDTRELRCD